MKLEITKEARIILAGALAGALLGALGSLLYYKGKLARSPSSRGTSGAAASRQAISAHAACVRIGALTWAAVGVIRQVIELAKEE